MAWGGRKTHTVVLENKRIYHRNSLSKLKKPILAKSISTSMCESAPSRLNTADSLESLTPITKLKYQSLLNNPNLCVINCNVTPTKTESK